MSLGENSLVAAYQGKGQLKSRPSGTGVVTYTLIHCNRFSVSRKGQSSLPNSHTQLNPSEPLDQRFSTVSVLRPLDDFPKVVATLSNRIDWVTRACQF